MDRRKRVDAIMNSRMFREELERIVDNQMKEGPSGILQQLSEMMGIPAARVGSVFKVCLFANYPRACVCVGSINSNYSAPPTFLNCRAPTA